MSISRWFTPPHLGFLCTVISLYKRGIHYTILTWGDWKEKMTWLDLTWTIMWLELTWLEQLCDLNWLDLNNCVTWIDLTWTIMWLNLTWLEKKQQWLDLTRDSSTFDLTWLVTRARVIFYNTGHPSFLSPLCRPRRSTRQSCWRIPSSTPTWLLSTTTSSSRTCAASSSLSPASRSPTSLASSTSLR